LKGIQGATGNWAAAFWVADSAPAACGLQSPVTVDLVNGAGNVELRATMAFAPVPLSAASAIPSGDANPAGHLAYLTLFWPTDPNAASEMGDTSGHCPTADFVPAAVEMSFGDSGVISAANLGGVDRQIAICGQRVSIQAVGPLPSA